MLVSRKSIVSGVPEQWRYDVDVRAADLTARPRLRELWKVARCSTEPQLALGVVSRKAAPRGEPRDSGTRTVRRPGSGRVECGDCSGDDGVEPCELPFESEERLGVRCRLGRRASEPVDGVGEGVEFHSE